MAIGSNLFKEEKPKAIKVRENLWGYPAGFHFLRFVHLNCYSAMQSPSDQNASPRSHKLSLILLVSVLLLGSGLLLKPIYLFIAESFPQLRGSWGWVDVSSNAPFSETLFDSNYRTSADRSRQILEQHRQELGLPALSAAVAIEGKLIWAGTVGWENLQADRAATPLTVFRVGSVSKAITATILARMVDSGEVELDVAISNYYASLPNRSWEPITLRQLASHTSGITDYASNRDWIGLYRTIALKQNHTDVVQGLSYFNKSRMVGEPGEFYLYSSYGTSLLSAVLQSVAQIPFADLVQAHINNPLGISTPLPAPPENHLATFYQLHKQRVRPFWDLNLSHRLAGGGFYATPSDLALIGSAWLNPNYISADTREKFWTHQTLADDSLNPDSYAIGWRSDENLWWTGSAELQYFHANHGGVSKGSSAFLIIIPEKRMSIALTMNTNVTPFSRWANIYLPLMDAFNLEP